MSAACDLTASAVIDTKPVSPISVRSRFDAIARDEEEEEVCPNEEEQEDEEIGKEVEEMDAESINREELEELGARLRSGRREEQDEEDSGDVQGGDESPC